MPQFVNHLDLTNCQLQNAVIHPSTNATRPLNPTEGQITYDTDEKTLYVWNNTTWATPESNDSVLDVETTAPLQHTEVSQVIYLTIDNATTSEVGVIKLAGDFAATSTALLPVVGSVGYGTANATTAAQIKDAVDKAHIQNTDTGTTAISFQIDSGNSGPRIKNVSGEMQVRNSTDSALADLRVGNLTVEGTTARIDSNIVNIGDSNLELNTDVGVSTSNSDGGLTIRRLQGDSAGTGTISSTGTAVTGVATFFTTEASVEDIIVFGAQRRRITAITDNTNLTIEAAFSPEPSGDTYSLANQSNAEIYFDNASGLWKVTDGAVTDLQTFPMVRKISQQIGLGDPTKVFVVTHNLNTRDVTVAVRKTASSYELVYPDVEMTSVDTITVSFNKAPALNEFTVVVTG